jgi:hypothetical protein
MHLLKKDLLWNIFVGLYIENPMFITKPYLKGLLAGSTSTFSNIHEVIDDNSNHYKSMVMNAMRINYGYSSEVHV